MVLRDATLTIVAGLIVGVAGSWALVGLMRSLLFGVEPHDPVTFAAAVSMLVVVALAAAYVPARRASHIEPVMALRQD